jgi:hypothetical protein
MSRIHKWAGILNYTFTCSYIKRRVVELTNLFICLSCGNALTFRELLGPVHEDSTVY